MRQLPSNSIRYAGPIFLILATLGMVAVMKDPPPPGTSRVPTRLPGSVGPWKAERILFCQNEQCGDSWREEAAGTNAACTTCESPLSEWSLGEQRILPKGTEIGRRLYVAPSGRSLLVSVVLSGAEQKSIHRPQQCLPAQGNVIERSQVIDVTEGGKNPLRVMWLDVRSRRAGGDSDRGFFVYWFVNGRQETPYHMVRLFWMSLDRLMGRPAQRWAYVSAYGTNASSQEETRREVTTFIRQLRPLLHLASDTQGSEPSQ